MTSAPADLQGPDLPADPTAYRKARRGVGYPALIVGVVIALAVGFVGARVSDLAFRKPAAAPAAPVAPSEPAPDLPLAPFLEPAAIEPPAPSGPELARLSDRIARLESGERAVRSAAAAALAAATLAEAAQTSRPFMAELSEVQAVIPGAADARALRRLAQSGVPTRAALAADFPQAAAKAAAAARKPAEGSGFIARATHALAAIFTVRRLDHATGNGPDAVLARAEGLANDGDLEGALAELDRLPPPVRDALGAWRGEAMARIEVDRRIAGLRRAALMNLTRTAEARP